jgi:nucleotide-binding universal stress UspA family protein
MDRTPMKILLAADGSAFTQIAARHLADHAQWFAKPLEVHVVHVHPPLPYAKAAAALGKSAVEAYQREDSLAALAVAEKELGPAGISYKSSWVVGDVAQEIARHVRDNGIDLVVMGSHGHSALASLALGSVAAKCIAALDVPVMIVRAPKR